MNKIEEIDCEILRFKAEILRLKGERLKAKAEMKNEVKTEYVKPEKPKFEHRCERCGRTWMGWKEVITECRFCKQSIIEVKPEVHEVNYKGIEAIDGYLKEHGNFTHVNKDVPSKTTKLYHFELSGDGVAYVKTVNGKEVERRSVVKIEEIIKDWALEPIMIGLGLMENPIRPKVIVEDYGEDGEVEEDDEVETEEEAEPIINTELFGKEEVG